MLGVTTLDVYLLLSVMSLMAGPVRGRRPCSSHHDVRSSSRSSSSRMDRCAEKSGGLWVSCSGGLHGKWKSGSEKVLVLTLCRWPDVNFDPETLLLKFPSLKKLTLMNSNVTSFSTSFPREARQLEHMNLTGNKLDQLPENLFSDLPALRILDLRKNVLSNVNPVTLSSPSLQRIYLAGNPWKCVSDIKWILDLRNNSVASRVSDRDEMLCSRPYNGRPLVPVVEIIATLEVECRQTICDCALLYVVVHRDKQLNRQLLPFVTVNCSYRGLTEMPSFLPENTTSLYLSGNQISDLTPLTTNPVYEKVIEIHLNNNKIESIAVLEGSYWLDHFRVMNLRNNSLTDLPTYALENVFHPYGNTASVYLGHNPWRCDCLFTPGFQLLLIRHTSLVQDINDVRCSYVNKDDNSNKQIRDLTRTAICMVPEASWLKPLDVLNVVLASLIFLILGKLLYDYWLFKKTGKLPWIVAKLP